MLWPFKPSPANARNDIDVVTQAVGDDKVLSPVETSPANARGDIDSVSRAVGDDEVLSLF